MRQTSPSRLPSGLGAVLPRRLALETRARLVVEVGYAAKRNGFDSLAVYADELPRDRLDTLAAGGFFVVDGAPSVGLASASLDIEVG